MQLTQARASSFARLALAGVVREFPNKPDHVLGSREDARTPRAFHPAFYGSYDWHSSVHSHWLLARVLRLFPALPEADDIHAVFARHFSQAALSAELAYLDRPNQMAFERSYGWAWLFRLTLEMMESTFGDAKVMTARLKLIADVFAQRWIDYLSRQHYPIRAGVHTNTAFALGFAHDYALGAKIPALAQAVGTAALRFFQGDRDSPARWEPNGNDFFSPGLMEADLMSRLLAGPHFARWLQGFLPGLETGQPTNLLEPAVVSDRADAQGVHLDGLNLSRAWCLRRIAKAHDARDPRREILSASASQHLAAGLAHVESGDFLGEHWLASFAVYALST
jgi:hypothetical protein